MSRVIERFNYVSARCHILRCAMNLDSTPIQALFQSTFRSLSNSFYISTINLYLKK